MQDADRGADAPPPESRNGPSAYARPHEGPASGSGLPPRPPDKTKKFEVHYSDGTTATVFASEVYVADSILFECEFRECCV